MTRSPQFVALLAQTQPVTACGVATRTAAGRANTVMFQHVGDIAVDDLIHRQVWALHAGTASL